MNKIAYLFGGILIGLTIAHYLNKPRAHVVGHESAGVEAEVVPLAKKKTAVTQQTKLRAVETKQVQMQGEQTTEASNFKPRQDDVRAPAKQRLELIINEELVNNLEKNWSDLPRQAKLENEEGGWRVRYVDQDSLFAETGLQAGDFISQQSIQSLKIANGENGYLSDRVIRIFNHVQ